VKRSLYLPPYLTDLNPIGHHWAWSKNKLSYLWRHVTNFYDRFSLALNLNMGLLSSSALYRPICRTSTPLDTTRLGPKISFPTSGTMLLIFMIGFLSLSILIWGYFRLAQYGITSFSPVTLMDAHSIRKSSLGVVYHIDPNIVHTFKAMLPPHGSQKSYCCGIAVTR
jgi:hypothetical protein